MATCSVRSTTWTPREEDDGAVISFHLRTSYRTDAPYKNPPATLAVASSLQFPSAAASMAELPLPCSASEELKFAAALLPRRACARARHPCSSLCYFRLAD